MFTRLEFNRLTDDQKFGFLYVSVVAADHAQKTLFAMVEDLQKRLEALEPSRPDISG